MGVREEQGEIGHGEVRRGRRGEARRGGGGRGEIRVPGGGETWPDMAAVLIRNSCCFRWNLSIIIVAISFVGWINVVKGYLAWVRQKCCLICMGESEIECAAFICANADYWNTFVCFCLCCVGEPLNGLDRPQPVQSQGGISSGACQVCTSSLFRHS
jgi:hypothetical protein